MTDAGRSIARTLASRQHWRRERRRASSPLSHSLSQTRPNGALSSPISTSAITHGLGGFAGKNRSTGLGGALPHTREVAGSDPAAPMIRKPRYDWAFSLARALRFRRGVSPGGPVVSITRPT